MDPTKKEEQIGFTPVGIDFLVSRFEETARRHLEYDYSISIEDSMLAALSELSSSKSIDIVLDLIGDDFTYLGFVDINIPSAEGKMENVLDFVPELFSDFIGNLGYSCLVDQNFKHNMKSILKEVVESTGAAVKYEESQIVRVHYSFNPRLVHININCPGEPDYNPNAKREELSLAEMNTTKIKPVRWLSSVTFNEILSEEIDSNYFVREEGDITEILDRLAEAISYSGVHEVRGDYDKATGPLIDFCRFYDEKVGGGVVFTGKSYHYLSEIRELAYQLSACYGAMVSLADTEILRAENGGVPNYDDGKIIADSDRIKSEMDDIIHSIMDTRRDLIKEKGRPEEVFAFIPRVPPQKGTKYLNR